MAPKPRGRSVARSSSIAKAAKSPVPAPAPAAPTPPRPTVASPPAARSYLAAAQRGAAASSMQLPDWVATWFAVASVVVFIDSIYVLGLTYGLGNSIPAPIKYLWSLYGQTDKQYAISGKGIKASNGWLPTQSQFNLLEVVGQLWYLHLSSTPSMSGTALSVAYATSVATLWKTMLYLAIIFNSNKPAKIFPAIKCFSGGVGAFFAQGSTCSADLAKFSFNLWWVILPALVIYEAHKRIARTA